MDLYSTFTETIDLRSFSALWYWIVVAMFWSMVSHWIMGVPFDMIRRAQRDDAVQADLEDLVRINSNRILGMASASGLWLLGFAAFLLTSLLILGFWYKVEFAQAVLLIIFPAMLIALMSLNVAAAIRERQLSAEPLRKRLIMHRMQVQGLGLFFIFITAMWGMYQNLSFSALY